MGGPSKTEIRSDDTLTKYIDGEITDKLLLKLFELELSEDPKLQYRLQNMVAIKSQIASILETKQIQPTGFVKNEIRKIVKNAQIPEALPDHDGEIKVTDSELLISSLIDGELAEPELSLVEKLITNNDTYRELYEQLVTSKIKISDTLLNENLEPNADVKMQISSLVAEHGIENPYKRRGKRNRVSSERMSSDMMSSDMMSSEEFANESFQEAGDQGADEDADLLEATPLPYGLIDMHASQPQKKRLASSLNYYAQRLVPLAAVFVVGLYISPTLFSSGPNEIPGLGPIRSGGGTQVESNSNFNFIEIIQSPGEGNKTNIYFNLTAPIAGRMFISLETSSQNDVLKVAKGKTSEVGPVKMGQALSYPGWKNMSFKSFIAVDKTDQLLRIDIEIRSDDKIFSFTEFVTIDQG